MIFQLRISYYEQVRLNAVFRSLWALDQLHYFFWCIAEGTEEELNSWVQRRPEWIRENGLILRSLTYSSTSAGEAYAELEVSDKNDEHLDRAVEAAQEAIKRIKEKKDKSEQEARDELSGEGGTQILVDGLGLGKLVDEGGTEGRGLMTSVLLSLRVVEEMERVEGR